MRFEDYTYTRPQLEEVKKEFNEAIKNINEANEVSEVIDNIKKINVIKKTFDTNASLAYIRHSIDVSDSFYEKEIEFFDETYPLYSEVDNNYYKALYNSKFKDQLIAHFGKHFFDKIALEIETFDPKIIPLLQQEAKLTSKYTKLIASCIIKFDNKELNLSLLRPYLLDSNREVRKSAEKAMWGFFEENQETIDNIFDELIKTRHQMALELGYPNYIELGYKKLGRSDYDSSDVSVYRNEVLNSLTPLATKIYEEQRKRLGLDKLYSYDLNLEFIDGNPKPIKGLDAKIEICKEMYHSLSEETKEFVDFMFDKNLIDLEAKPNKSGGGYCTFLYDYDSPFVFANFNETSADIDVLTHEFGHAFQSYCSKDFEILEYMSPTLEACEIHSMSMEFFAYPYMPKFFKDDYHKYLYSHLTSSLTFIPYGVLIDHFQHVIYENPNLTINQRKEEFRKLEKQYMPYVVYENDFLNQGNYFVRQSHIFTVPFYYIDYTLAQNIAHQFFILANNNKPLAWEKYLKLCNLGGSKSFVELVQAIGLNSPFKKGTLDKTIKELEPWVNKFKNELF